MTATTSSSSTLMATSAASVAARPAMSNPMTTNSHNDNSSSNAARRRTTYNPTITAMLALSRCDEVVKMTQECLAKKDSGGLCHTAERYMSVCMNKSNKNKA